MRTQVRFKFSSALKPMRSNMKQDDFGYVYLFWACDKRNCGKLNHRMFSGFYHIINDDNCDECGKHIHEPILVEYDPYYNIETRNATRQFKIQNTQRN